MKPFVWSSFVALLIIPAATLTAQDTSQAFPTVTALNEAIIPPRDLTELAQRLEGVGAIAPPTARITPLPVGTIDTFWADNTSQDRSFQVKAELKVVGEHIYIWVQEGENLSQDGLQRLANDFDAQVYSTVRALWGSEATPGVDGDPRIHALFVRDLGTGVAAYFSAKHAYPRQAVPTSNAREMFFFNLDAVNGMIGDFALTSITAHEFQHMIRSNIDSNEAGWIDEGLSEFTQFYLGDNNLFAVVAFHNSPNTQLNTWTENGNRTADYGASNLWIIYLHERFGIEGLNTLSADPADGMVGVDNLARQHGTTANELFADWVLANLILDPTDTPEGIYGYTSLDGLPGARQTAYDSLPIQQTLQINQYAANYLTLNRQPNTTQLHIQVEGSDVVTLAPVQSPTNTPMWYSNRADDSNTRLTLPLDLTQTTDPTLTFDLWYHIENLWDYSYVMVSTDGGASWDTLQSDEMTTNDPHQLAYGAAYTGISGGGAASTWVNEQIPLANYTGQNILLRFEMIYDDAVNQPGMFIDRVTVTDNANGTVVYSSNFSEAQAASPWAAEGWVLTDNRLPQQVWVQAVQYIGDEKSVTRWLLQGGFGDYTLPLHEKTDRTVIALAPFAPTTTVPANLTVNIRAQ